MPLGVAVTVARRAGPVTLFDRPVLTFTSSSQAHMTIPPRGGVLGLTVVLRCGVF